MAKSQQTYNKKEKEKGGGGIPFAYVDHNGNLSDTPPDPAMKVKIDAESISLDYKKEHVEVDPIRKGKVSFFDTSKGFGFITDSENQEKYFTHVSGLIDQITENDKVQFELEKGMKGLNAVRVKKI